MRHTILAGWLTALVSTGSLLAQEKEQVLHLGEVTSDPVTAREEPSPVVQVEPAVWVWPGERVRVTVENDEMTGTVVSVDENGFDLDLGKGKPVKPIAVRYRDVQRLERSLGRENHWKEGLLFGAMPGIGIIALLMSLEAEGDGAEAVAAIGLVLAGTGGLLGMGLGALIHSEEWSHIPMRPLDPLDEAPIGGDQRAVVEARPADEDGRNPGESLTSLDEVAGIAREPAGGTEEEARPALPPAAERTPGPEAEEAPAPEVEMAAAPAAEEASATEVESGSTIRPGDPGRRKNPWLAFGLSALIPGTGQFYNGQHKKGIPQLGAAMAGSALVFSAVRDNYEALNGNWVDADDDDRRAVYGGILWLGGLLWSVIDAPASARRINREVTLDLHPVFGPNGTGARLVIRYGSVLRGSSRSEGGSR